MVSCKVILEENNPTLRFASEEFLRHINMLELCDDKASELVISFTTEGKNERADSYCYNIGNKESYFKGSNPRSVLLSVYDYLRRLGFVFFSPEDSGVYVPAITYTKELFCDEVRVKPSFIHRGVCIEGANSIENVISFIDWLPKNGYNTFFTQFKKPDTFFERWYEHRFNPLLESEHKTAMELDEMEKTLTDAIVLRGIIDHRVGHGWTAGALGCEATGWDEEKNELPPEKLELAAQLDGKRGLFCGIPTNTNLCYSNPRAINELVNQVVSYAKDHKSVDYLHFWLADTANNVCECEQCQKAILTDQYVAILNELDRGLTDAGLDTKIVFLLYQELLYAPINERINNPDRFCLMFAPISRTFEKSYPKISEPIELHPYIRNKFVFPETVEENISHYLNWKKIYNGDCFFYDYPLGRAHYGDFGYMKIAKTIYDDIHSLMELNSDGYMSCQELRAMTPTAFPNYCMGQALINLDKSYEDIKREYFLSAFGSNYEPVVMYLEQLSELSDTDYFNGHGARKQPEKRKQFVSISETALAFLMDLPELRSNDERYKKNWDFLEFHGKYSILLSTALAALCDGNQEDADRYFDEFCDYIRKNETLWQPRLDVYRVIEVATGYTGFTRK